VLDGHQRLQTLKDFYSGLHRGREFELENVGDRFKGLTYSSLSAEQRRTLDNTFIQATIVRTDGSPSSLDAVYQVFERLNSGGTQLTAHEIRVALYAGPMIDFLADLNHDKAWRDLYGRESPRLRDQELVLRIVALYASPGTYQRPLKKYLNDFAARHRNLEDLPSEGIRERFESCAQLVQTSVGSSALRLGEGGQVNAALTEAMFVGLCRRLDAGPIQDARAVKTAIGIMRQNDGFTHAVSRATADEESVRTRLAVATQAFAAI
jgi:hypothetical protein